MSFVNAPLDLKKLTKIKIVIKVKQAGLMNLVVKTFFLEGVLSKKCPGLEKERPCIGVFLGSFFKKIYDPNL